MKRQLLILLFAVTALGSTISSCAMRHHPGPPGPPRHHFRSF